MTSFEFDRTPSPGTNRTAATTDCPTCGGDRFMRVIEDEDPDREVYVRCPACNPATAREPVAPDAWWKQ